MKRTNLVMLFVAACLSSLQAEPDRDTAKATIDSNSAIAEAAIIKLRQKGAAGLDELLAALEPEIERYRVHLQLKGQGNLPEEFKRLTHAIDSVAQQRDAFASRLFWHTDLEAAKEESKRTGKPIVSLRLLGKLTDELSCANSRFFRTVLYADGAISDLLRRRAVLHWESVRPVPKVTIDFGDGRVLERTITGNSIHYILNSDGAVIDALPGLYQPTVFREELAGAFDFLAANRMHPAAVALTAYLEIKRTRLLNDWAADLNEIGYTLPARTRSAAANERLPRAAEAMPIAASKSAVETPLLRLVSSDRQLRVISTAETAELQKFSEPQIWEALASKKVSNTLSPESIALIQAKTLAARAMEQAQSKRLVENPMLRLLANLEMSLAADTLKNQYEIRPKILSWLMSQKVVLAELNDRVYAELFLTPKEDPWLGLRPENTFSALVNDGVQAPGAH